MYLQTQTSFTNIDICFFLNGKNLLLFFLMAMMAIQYNFMAFTAAPGNTTLEESSASIHAYLKHSESLGL